MTENEKKCKKSKNVCLNTNSIQAEKAAPHKNVAKESATERRYGLYFVKPCLSPTQRTGKNVFLLRSLLCLYKKYNRHVFLNLF